jgi:ribonuclease BN (tRNA processing enzyme)
MRKIRRIFLTHSHMDHLRFYRCWWTVFSTAYVNL